MKAGSDKKINPNFAFLHRLKPATSGLTVLET